MRNFPGCQLFSPDHAQPWWTFTGKHQLRGVRNYQKLSSAQLKGSFDSNPPEKRIRGWEEEEKRRVRGTDWFVKPYSSPQAKIHNCGAVYLAVMAPQSVTHPVADMHVFTHTHSCMHSLTNCCPINTVEQQPIGGVQGRLKEWRLKKKKKKVHKLWKGDQVEEPKCVWSDKRDRSDTHLGGFILFFAYFLTETNKPQDRVFMYWCSLKWCQAAVLGCPGLIIEGLWWWNDSV